MLLYSGRGCGPRCILFLYFDCLCTVNVEIFSAVHIFTLFTFLKNPRKYIQLENYLYYVIIEAITLKKHVNLCPCEIANFRKFVNEYLYTQKYPRSQYVLYPRR